MLRRSTRRIPADTACLVCRHVFDRSRPVLLVDSNDGIWCFLCGHDDHAEDPDDYCVVGVGHLLEDDESLVAVLGLRDGEVVERRAVGASWSRSRRT